MKGGTAAVSLIGITMFTKMYICTFNSFTMWYNETTTGCRFGYIYMISESNEYQSTHNNVIIYQRLDIFPSPLSGRYKGENVITGQTFYLLTVGRGNQPIETCHMHTHAPTAYLRLQPLCILLCEVLVSSNCFYLYFLPI